MLRFCFSIILLFSQVVLFAQVKTDSMSSFTKKAFLQFGYFEDNSFDKVSGFNTIKLGLIKNHSDNKYWGYNLIHFRGDNSYITYADYLIIDSSGIRIETMPVTVQEELALYGLDVSYYRNFITKKRFNLGMKCSAGYSYRRRKQTATYQVNNTDNSLSLKANLFSMYKISDRIDLYVDLNLLHFNLFVRNIKLIDGDTIRNDGSSLREEFDFIGKSINRLHLGIAYNF